jgi:hypothetical protein
VLELCDRALEHVPELTRLVPRSRGGMSIEQLDKNHKRLLVFRSPRRPGAVKSKEVSFEDFDSRSKTLCEVFEEGRGRGDVVAVAEDGLSGVGLEGGFEAGGVVLQRRRVNDDAHDKRNLATNLAGSKDLSGRRPSITIHLKKRRCTGTTN